MDKTLGQIAHEAGEVAGRWQRKWATMGASQRADWEFIAAAVAYAVKEEDARICLERKGSEWFRNSDGEMVEIPHASNVVADKCAAAIRASIKEGK